MDKVRSRCWVLVLYPDDETHIECLHKLQAGGYTYAAIKHDKDTWEDGESEKYSAGDPKKEHFHVVLRFTNPRWIDSVADELGVKSNYIEQCRNRDAALLYLVHEGFPNKYQYDIDDVEGPLALNLQKLLADDDEGQRVKTIVSMIDSSPGRVRYREILLKACDAGLYGEFRRLGTGVKWLIDEHNEELDEVLLSNMGVNASFDDFREFIKWNERFRLSGRSTF